jgi:serine/threonine protein kinase
VIYELAALRPPFMAKDMNGLYQKVTKGVFPNIPSRFSGDLYFLISKMLTVDPALRPSADQLLLLEIVIKRQHTPQLYPSLSVAEQLSMQESQCNLGDVNDSTREDFLLDTIVLPKNPKNIALPKSNYGEVIIKKMSRKRDEGVALSVRPPSPTIGKKPLDVAKVRKNNKVLSERNITSLRSQMPPLPRGLVNTSVY